MPPALPPELTLVLENAWQFLQNGIRDPLSHLRTPVLATVDRDCRPDARTVVVERVHPESRKFYVNTDRRSPKFDEMRFKPEAVFVFFENDTQIRVQTTVEVHFNDVVARRSWDALPAEMRALYITHASPGTPAHEPTTGLHPGINPTAPPLPAVEAGFDNYAVLEATATHLDWLHISPQGHRRAAFRWNEHGEPEGSWVYP